MKNNLRGLQSFAVAAKRLKRDPSRLRQLRLAGKLPQAVKLGRDWYLPKGAKLPTKGLDK